MPSIVSASQRSISTRSAMVRHSHRRPRRQDFGSTRDQLLVRNDLDGRPEWLADERVFRDLVPCRALCVDELAARRRQRLSVIAEHFHPVNGADICATARIQSESIELPDELAAELIAGNFDATTAV